VAGVSTVLDIVDDAVPPVDNDAGLVGGAGTVLRTVLGDSAVVMIDEPTPSFSEDFSHFQRQIPGAMVFLGVSNAEKGIMGLPHHPMFAADEDAIGVGARAMAAVLIDYLESK
jgi:amidohydrolase